MHRVGLLVVFGFVLCLGAAPTPLPKAAVPAYAVPFLLTGDEVPKGYTSHGPAVGRPDTSMPGTALYSVDFSYPWTSTAFHEIAENVTVFPDVQQAQMSFKGSYLSGFATPYYTPPKVGHARTGWVLDFTRICLHTDTSLKKTICVYMAPDAINFQRGPFIVTMRVYPVALNRPTHARETQLKARAGAYMARVATLVDNRIMKAHLSKPPRVP